ncbi:FG-GAP-like repeat-containing protein [Embleya sp. NPDC059259]|uniref:FG-GAP-like repeat-containing protein n=1 Tax=unclassified Embleya TaxID=2699296 RepID=UPI0036B8DDFB
MSALVCGLVTLSMACGMAAAGAAPRDASGAGAQPAAAEAPPTDAKTGAERTAVAQAVRTGVPVPVPELTTATDKVTAKPDGRLALERTVEPSRTNKTGVWRDLDPTLAAAADGTVRPAVTTSDLALGGGGNRLLASMTNNGRTLAFTWPTTLPKPVLSGDGALYPGVLPDVDLKVVAGEQGGFSHTLIVKNAAAAKDPRLAALKLGMTTDGVTVTDAGNGSFAAKAADGVVAFTAPTPTMWDSRTTPGPVGRNPRTAAADASSEASGTSAGTGGASGAGAIPEAELASTDRRPGALAATAPLGTAVAGDTLTLTPDANLLTAPDTVFPVYIDPSWIPTRTGNAGMWNWVWGAAAYQNTSGRTSSRSPGVGYQGWQPEVGIERAFYSVPLDLPGKQILEAQFHATQVDSSRFSCTEKSPVRLFRVQDTLTEHTTWNTQPHELGQWSVVDVAGSSADASPKCGDTRVDFPIRDKVAQNAASAILTFGLFGNETNDYFFNRFSSKAGDTFLYVEYNTKPNAPSNLRMTPVPVNGAASGNAGYIGAVNPAAGGVSLYATLTDADAPQNLKAQFHIRDVGNGDVLVHDSGWISWGANGHEARADIPVGKLLDGHTYIWWVGASDEGPEPTWVPGQTFTVDATPPSTPTVASLDYPVAGGGKYARDKGTFTFTAGDNASGVDTVEYALNATVPVGGAARATWDDVDKTWKAKDVLIPNWGSNTLYAQTVDKAGNRSQPTIHTFYAPSDPNAKTTLGDITGDGRVDLLTTDDTGALRMYGTNTDPTAGGVVASNTIQGPPNATNKPTWAGSLITHRGGTGVTYDDLYAHANGHLYLYRGGGANAGGQYFTSNKRADIPRPETCVDPTRPGGTCLAYTRNWGQVKQILAPGNVDADVNPSGAARLDLLTLEDNGDGTRRLWLFHGGANPGSFTEATPLGSTGWNNLDPIAPGDTTGDGLPDLWARDRVTGQLFQYASKKNPDGSVDTAALGNTSARTLVGTGFDGAAYPRLNSDGDLDGDGKADLWGQAADGRLYVALGITPGADGNAFGPMRLIADNQTPWTTCEKYASAGDANVKLDLCGPILAKYKATGGPTGPLRLPTTGVHDDTAGGKWADFQGTATGGTTNAGINWSPYTGAWSIAGGIRDKWLAMGGTGGFLGYPVSDENPVTDGAGTPIGHVSRFAGNTNGTGSITYAANTGAHEIHGSIHARWQAMGGPRSVLGFPSTDETATPTKPGRYQHFRVPGASADTGSIYHTTATGSWPVSGGVRDRWAALGWENGYLGFPTTGAYDLLGGRRTNFQNGYIHARDGGVHDAAWAPHRLIASADFDNDGHADIVTVDDNGSLWMLTTTPDGTLGTPVGLWPDGTWTAIRSITAGDFNHDGRADIVALRNDGSLWLYTGRGDATLNDAIRLWPDNSWASVIAITAADIDNDGNSDIVAIWGDGTLSLYKGRGDNTLADPTPLWNDKTWNGMRLIAGGDFNSDHLADLVAVDTTGRLWLYTTRPDHTLNDAVPLWNDNTWNTVRAITTGDTDNNNHADITAIWADGTLHIYPNPTP